MLAARMNAAAEADAAKEAEKARQQLQKEYEKTQREFERASRPKRPASTHTTTRTPSTRTPANPLGDLLGSRTGQTIVREVLRGVFGTLKRR